MLHESGRFFFFRFNLFLYILEVQRQENEGVHCQIYLALSFSAN